MMISRALVQLALECPGVPARVLYVVFAFGQEVRGYDLYNSTMGIIANGNTQSESVGHEDCTTGSTYTFTGFTYTSTGFRIEYNRICVT